MARWHSTEYYWWPKSGPLANRRLKFIKYNYVNMPRMHYTANVMAVKTDSFSKIKCIII